VDAWFILCYNGKITDLRQASTLIGDEGVLSMTGQITQFKIDSLHHRRTINVPIRNNTLILVGENGTGKSTVANFIYFFLTRQWHRMLTYEFNQVSAIIDNKEIALSRDEIVYIGNQVDPTDPRFRKIPRSILRAFEATLSNFSVEDIARDPDLYINRLTGLGYPGEMALEYVLQFLDQDLPLFSYKAKEVSEYLSAAITSQVLYLPTYRRIEQDLKAILPGFDFTRSKATREAFIQKRPNNSYIELVKFGMEDVQETFQEIMEKLKDEIRNDLSNLTGTYLRDVIQGAYQSANAQKIIDLDDNAIELIFSRIDKSILSEVEQKTLRNIINKIKKETVISDNDKVVAHFLTQLVDLYKSQQEKERDVLEFVKVCNDYLRGKKITYDNIKFKIYIEQLIDDSIDADIKRENIDLKMLSSGEKQIVSLFSHIYLSGKSGYFVIIDEPELSLSVPWQKRFLPNILDTGRCNGLIAVTHSPFIFDNSLDLYTHSLEEFVG